MLDPKLLEWKRSLRRRFYDGFTRTVLGELASVGFLVFFLIFRDSFWNIRSDGDAFGQDKSSILFWCIAIMIAFGCMVACTVYLTRYILDRRCLKNNACPKICGKFIRFKKNIDPESDTQSNTLAIVRELDTGKEICLTVEEQDDLVPGICYEFLYLPRTKHAYTVGALDEREEDTADTLPASENILQVSHMETGENTDTEAKRVRMRKRYFVGFALTVALDIVTIACLIALPACEWLFTSIFDGKKETLHSILRIVFGISLCIACGFTISLIRYIQDWKRLKSGSFSTVRGQFVALKFGWGLKPGAFRCYALVGCPNANGVEFRLAVSGEKLIPGAYYEFRYLPNTGIAYVAKQYHENKDT